MMDNKSNSKTKLKVNDTVRVLCGKDRGKEGKVLKIDTHRNTVAVSGVNIAKKAMRKRRQEDKGGIMDIEQPLHLSNVQIVSKGKRSRLRYVVVEGAKGKKRKAVKTGEVL